MNNKKLLVIIAAALALLVGLTIVIVACTQGETGGENGDDNRIDVGDETDEDGNVIEGGDEIGTGNQTTEVGDPKDYKYTECDQVVYVNSGAGAVNLRSESYEIMGSVKDGTQLRRTGLSNDEAKSWSMVVYEGETYYVISKFLTDVNPENSDQGFTEIEKTVVVNDKTGSLNIRDLPSLDGSQVIGWAVAGTEYKVVAENTTTGWYKIEFIPYGSDKTAYGYIKSGADNFVKGDDTDVEDEKDTSDTTNESDSVSEGNSGK